MLITKLKSEGTKIYLISLVGLISYPPTKNEFERMYFARGMKRKYEIYKSIHNKYQEVLEELAIETESIMINLRNVIKTEDDRRIYYDIMHTNLQGAQVYGDYISSILNPIVGKFIEEKN